jgi:predicted phage baseplate assembly protein
VIVNGVLWEEQATLSQGTAVSQVYTTVEDDQGETSVVFGDGYHGVRPPSGRDNIRARYRKGLGTSGNLDAGAISQLVDSIPGLQSVSNPLPSSGGADPALPDQVRALAPATMRAFGRAVSVADYKGLALGFPGVAKASADWVVHDPERPREVVHPYVRLTLATTARVPLAQQPTFSRNLRVYLDQRRDTSVGVRLADAVPVYLDVAATVDIDDRYPRLATVARVQAALQAAATPGTSPGYFAFERVQFGQTFTLGTLYAAIQAVAGVRDATVTTFRRLDQDPDPGTVRDVIALGPSELAVIANDPNDPTLGTLTITPGAGGFRDS